ncbi:MAG: hypothetical protein MJZ20_05540 [Bacteroidaceae bacterium]|nr:hypothetical protein [Bacteroidaceae bacterium]
MREFLIFKIQIFYYFGGRRRRGEFGGGGEKSAAVVKKSRLRFVFAAFSTNLPLKCLFYYRI